MRFECYGPSGVKGAKVDWLAVELTDELRNALHPQPPESMRSGVLRRAFDARRRNFEMRHPKGSLVFSLNDEFFYLQVDDTPEP